MPEATVAKLAPVASAILANARQRFDDDGE
jgi:hypothetical protein